MSVSRTRTDRGHIDFEDSTSSESHLGGSVSGNRWLHRHPSFLPSDDSSFACGSETVVVTTPGSTKRLEEGPCHDEETLCIIDIPTSTTKVDWSFSKVPKGERSIIVYLVVLETGVRGRDPSTRCRGRLREECDPRYKLWTVGGDGVRGARPCVAPSGPTGTTRTDRPTSWSRRRRFPPGRTRRRGRHCGLSPRGSGPTRTAGGPAPSGRA